MLSLFRVRVNDVHSVLCMNVDVGAKAQKWLNILHILGASVSRTEHLA